MYKFANVGSTADKACFDRFFGIAERLGVDDAILYNSCRELLCGLGDINGHLTVIDDLVRRGHFTSMVASFALHIIYKKDNIGRSLHSLSGIFEHVEFKGGIALALANLESIYAATGRPVVRDELSVGGACHIHAAKEKMLALSECTTVFDCFFCSIGLMLKVFSRKGATM